MGAARWHCQVAVPPLLEGWRLLCWAGVLLSTLPSSFWGGDALGRMGEPWEDVGGAGMWLCPLSVVQVGCGCFPALATSWWDQRRVVGKEEEDGVVFPEAGGGSW